MPVFLFIHRNCAAFCRHSYSNGSSSIARCPSFQCVFPHVSPFATFHLENLEVFSEQIAFQFCPPFCPVFRPTSTYVYIFSTSHNETWIACRAFYHVPFPNPLGQGLSISAITGRIIEKGTFMVFAHRGGDLRLHFMNMTEISGPRCFKKERKSEPSPRRITCWISNIDH